MFHTPAQKTAFKKGTFQTNNKPFEPGYNPQHMKSRKYSNF